MKTVETATFTDYQTGQAFYFANKLAEAFIIIQSDDIMIKLKNLERALPVVFRSPLPSMRQEALIGG